MLKLSTHQMGRLIFKSLNEPRRNQKSYLRDLGGDGSAEELDRILLEAQKSPKALEEAERISKMRRLMSRAVDAGIDGRVVEMLAAIRVKMDEKKLTQREVAEFCGWAQPLVAAYLTGAKEPGIGNLAKLASAVGCVWFLAESSEGAEKKAPE